MMEAEAEKDMWQHYTAGFEDGVRDPEPRDMGSH